MGKVAPDDMTGDAIWTSADRLPPKRPLGWWYYAKKSFALFPGVAKPVSANFLASHYGSRAADQSVARRAMNALLYAGFQLWVPGRAKRVARTYGLDREWARRAATIARSTFTDPNDIALFRIESADQLADYIRRFEHADISKRINPLNWKAECALANKIDFYARCAAHGLQQPRLLALAINGKARVGAVPARGAIAAKPAGGEGGSGFRMIEAAETDVASAEAFGRFIERQLGDTRGEWLVQERITPHPDLQDLALAALPTCRITTMRNESDEVEIVTSVLRFPSDPASRVDNIKSGGLMAPIDLASGRLGIGCRGRGVGDFARHPTNDAQIEGRQLPFWEESKALAIDAHSRAFPEYALVGWDVAISPSGPTLIEGNGKPCMIVAQRAPRKGIGGTRFGELVAYHLRRTQETKSKEQ